MATWVVWDILLRGSAPQQYIPYNPRDHVLTNTCSIVYDSTSHQRWQKPPLRRMYLQANDNDASKCFNLRSQVNVSFAHQARDFCLSGGPYAARTRCRNEYCAADKRMHHWPRDVRPCRWYYFHVITFRHCDRDFCSIM